MQEKVQKSFVQRFFEFENRHFTLTLRVCVVILALMAALVYLLPTDVISQPPVRDTLKLLWSPLCWLGMVAFIIALAELIVVAYRYFHDHSYDNRRLGLGLASVVIYVFFLGIGTVAVPWNHKVVTSVDTPEPGTSTYESAKAQIDICNIKSISYLRDPLHPQQSSGDMILYLYKASPDIDKNGHQIAVTDKMKIAFDNRDRVKKEIDQLKPSCPKDIPVTVVDG